MKKSILTLAIASAITPFAQANEVEPIVVTATRTAQTADQSLASVTVISREQIEKSSAHTVEELLSRQAGIDIAVNGGYGKQTSMFLRGTSSEHTLVLIDGLKAGSVSNGATAYQLLPLAQVERIEIVRGPRSSLYGSEAAGGVIQIFTRKGGKESRTKFQTGAGSNQLRRDSLSTSGTVDNNRYNISLSSLKTDGFDAVKPVTNFFGTVDEADDDGYTNQSASISLQRTFANGLEMDFHLMHSQGNSEYDSSTADSSTDFVQQAGGVKLDYNVNEMWFSRLTMGETRDKSDILAAGYHVGTTYNSRRTQYNWQNDLMLNENSMLTVGVDHIKDKLDSTGGHTESSRDNTGLFAQYQSSIGKHDYQLSLRNDDNEVFGRETTGSAAWGYATTETLRITANYGTAFITPDFNGLYWPATASFVGNPNLKPETSKTTEIGLSGKQSWGSWKTNLFRTQFENLIAYNASAFPGYMSNLNRAKIEGIELEVASQLAGWNTSAQITTLDPRNEETNKRLQRRAKSSLNFDINREFNKTEIGLNLFAQSMRFNDTANTTPITGYGIATIYGSLELNKHWRLNANMANIGGKDYATVDTYNTAGRTIFVSVSYDTL